MGCLASSSGFLTVLWSYRAKKLLCVNVVSIAGVNKEGKCSVRTTKLLFISLLITIICTVVPSKPIAGQDNHYYYAYAFQILGGNIAVFAVDPQYSSESIHLFNTLAPSDAILYSALASPDGQWIALVLFSLYGQSVIRLVNVNNEEIIDIPLEVGFGIIIEYEEPSLLGQLQGIAWSPNSLYLGFIGDDGETANLYAYDMAHRTLIQITSDNRKYTLAWSPDSQHLATSSTDCSSDPCNIQIETYNFNSTVQEVIASVGLEASAGLAALCQIRWSPDGRYVSFAKSCDVLNSAIPKELYLLDTLGNDAIPLTDYTTIAIQPPGAPIDFYPIRWAAYDPVWVDDHTMLVGSVHAEDTVDTAISQIIAYDVQTQTQSILRDDIMATDWAVNPISEAIAFHSVTGYRRPQNHIDIQVATYANGVLSTAITAPAGCDLAWSPDGEYLAYTDRGQPLIHCYSSVNGVVFIANSTGQIINQPLSASGNIRPVGWVALME